MSRSRPGARSSPRRGAKAGRPRARAPLSRDRVLSTAVRLADRGGLESLSMRKLAMALRVEAMSLYHHVASRDDLLDGMVERVVAEIDVPVVDAPWKEEMRRRALSARAVLRRHPWAPALLMARINVGPHMLRYIDATLGCLRGAGFTIAQTDYAWNAIDCYVYGFTLHEQNFPLEPKEYASAAESFLPMLPADRYPNMRALTEELIAGRHDGLVQIEFGLELILDGLERLLGASRSG
jgi:AcrR family transcriptional regulator